MNTSPNALRRVTSRRRRPCSYRRESERLRAALLGAYIVGLGVSITLMEIALVALALLTVRRLVRREASFTSAQSSRNAARAAGWTW